MKIIFNVIKEEKDSEGKILAVHGIACAEGHSLRVSLELSAYIDPYMTIGSMDRHYRNSFSFKGLLPRSNNFSDHNYRNRKLIKIMMQKLVFDFEILKTIKAV